MRAYSSVLLSIAIQVDPQPDGRRPDSVLSYEIDSSSDTGIVSLVSSDGITATAGAFGRAASGSLSSTNGTKSDETSIRAPVSVIFICQGDPDSETRPAEPQSDACSLGQSTRPPSPSECSDSNSAPRRPAYRDISRPPLTKIFGGRQSASACVSSSTQPGTSGYTCMTAMRTRTHAVCCCCFSANSPPKSSITSAGRPSSTPDAYTSNAPRDITERPAGLSWHCRSCGKHPCDRPTATACGHIFCYGCVV